VSEGRDDSLAVDLAVAKPNAVLVWDDVRRTPGAEQMSNVMIASLDVASMRTISQARPLSGPRTDATAPRVIARPGGYWLAYLARGEEDPKRKPVARDDGQTDDSPQGEAIVPGWVEVVPLDEAGVPTSTPHAVTSKTGHAVSFDLELSAAGGALLLVRDDDTPLGASGGKLTMLHVSLGGASDTRLVAEESDGTGTPTLLRGFLAVTSGTGATQIATIGPQGELLEPLGTEPSLGVGLPIASTDASILWARPQGGGMRLSVVRCLRRGSRTSDAGP
jgi:hypothetical protein